MVQIPLYIFRVHIFVCRSPVMQHEAFIFKERNCLSQFLFKIDNCFVGADIFILFYTFFVRLSVLFLLISKSFATYGRRNGLYIFFGSSALSGKILLERFDENIKIDAYVRAG